MTGAECGFPGCDRPAAEGPMCTGHRKVTVAANGSWSSPMDPGERPEDDR